MIVYHTNIIEGLASELTEKQLTELLGESIASVKPDSGRNSGSSSDKETIIIEEEIVEETIEGSKTDGSSQQEDTQQEQELESDSPVQS
jgi:hypothetical protein